MPPYTHPIFPYFNNQFHKLQLPPKNFNQKCSNLDICEESVPGSSFKKDSQFNSNCSIDM